MTFRREWFKTYTPFTSDHPIYLGDNSTLLAEGMGDIEIQAYVDGGWYNTYIRNVLYSPQLKKNLYSLSTSTRRGFNVIIKHDKLQIFMDNDLKAVGVRHDSLYRMLFKVTSSSQGYITSENKLQLWHERLAHLPVATLREMATKGLVDGLQPQDLEGEFFFCEGCQLGKAHRKSCYPSDGKNYQLDITYAVSQVSKFLEYPGPAHCTTVKNIFRYLKGMGTLFTGQDQLVGYSDSDFARDVDSRKSTTGYAFMMNGGTVSWASQRQPIIALSTTESEYIAACSAAKELIWIRRLLQGIGCDITKETELYIDNQAAIKLVENPVFHKRTKHIDVRYHFIRSKHEEDASMYGIGDNSLDKPLGEVDITFSPHYSNMLFTAKALILNKITCNLPNFVMERNNQLRKFWELDSIPPCTQPILTKEEMDCEQHFKTNVLRTTTGRYQVYYMPHHCVLKEESTTTNLRVVFDASACSDDSPSLNKALHIDPKLQTDIFDLLLRFRTFFVALSADIEKMYRQILIHPDDSDYQRVLWRDSPSDAIQEYKLTTITYGTACAPYLAIRTLHQLADDEAMNYPVASEIVKRDFYVDDLLTGADTVEEAQGLIRQIIALLAEGGFPIRKWVSNSPKILEFLPKDQKGINQSFDFKDLPSVKLLGILWDPTLDSFTIRIEAILNSRPLLPLDSNFDSYEALTPSHFLIGSPILAIPDEVVDDLNHISRWKCIQSMKISFWKKWSQDYLNLLQARPRWHRTHQDLQSGQLVLMKQDSTPPHHWPLARIIKTYKGPDGHVRVVDLKTPKNVLKRPITKIAPLPFKE
ncbi:hypothetical protein LAZ67_10001934 [Cordylochernes scorpioides]|uniref:Gag-pol polyprotein n=1 Tax=Cordylochernes scorpioides TaxID=51811 RepID=A0ABY6KW85_9ARAC|nr:hypothetical protein LAZ67_10001934 [Cordylochernes scorpioides]